MFSFGDIHTIWGLEVIPSHNIIDVVNSSWSETNFSEISWPDSTICIFGLVLGEIGWINMVMNVSISGVPFLIIILFEVMVSRVNCKILSNPC